MQHKEIFAVGLATAYMFIYLGFLQFGLIENAMFMLAFSPIIIIGMVLVVLRSGKYTGRTLGEDEFGYQDKKKEDLGVF